MKGPAYPPGYAYAIAVSGHRAVRERAQADARAAVKKALRRAETKAIPKGRR